MGEGIGKIEQKKKDSRPLIVRENLWGRGDHQGVKEFSKPLPPVPCSLQSHLLNLVCHPYLKSLWDIKLFIFWESQIYSVAQSEPASSPLKETPSSKMWTEERLFRDLILALWGTFFPSSWSHGLCCSS